jgi:hypothetical protein
MPLSVKQKREKKDDKKKKTRDGKIKKRDGIMTLVEAMGKTNHVEYEKMRRQFRDLRRAYRKLVAGGTENINKLELKELLKKRAEILDFLTRIENAKIVSGKTEKQRLVANTRFHFTIETDSRAKLLEELTKKTMVPLPQVQVQNDKDIVEVMVEEKNQSDSSSDSSSDSIRDDDIYMVVTMYIDNTYQIKYEQYRGAAVEGISLHDYIQFDEGDDDFKLSELPWVKYTSNYHHNIYIVHDENALYDEKLKRVPFTLVFTLAISDFDKETRNDMEVDFKKLLESSRYIQV